MLTIDNFKDVLINLGFSEDKHQFTKSFSEPDVKMIVDFNKKELIYPEDKGLTINERQTCNFSQKENFVVFECVVKLLDKGYKPEHIELEPRWKVGHGASGGRADILVKDNSQKSLLIIECKTAGKEFEDAWKKTLINGGQLLTYAKQAGSTQFVCLYASDYIDQKVVRDYYLITLKDNESLLNELSDQEPLSFEDAKKLEVEDIFKAWKETYRQDYSTRGIFEGDIPPYEIGKTKYSLEDLSSVSSRDIQGKYHQFATILRQHNVSGRENAFDKLVNLFLCKIVDETNNPEELKFYWKGVAYDSYFELQDRLQKLYQEGMKRFLGEDVTYIDNSAIDDAFRFFKQDPDATRDTIKKYFRELKFFTNNDFAFIDVHNEKLFYQNSQVLLKIVQMLQDILLKSDEDNQFLGDMFEGFLDQGVKQSEGQFFTPMPIVKFILKSLPLEQIIEESEQLPKAIDYACGAGHFLNQYAQEIQNYVNEKKDIPIEKYYENIVGIEKEYRLSKVAKVSAFMYGQDDIDIVYSDALSKSPTIKDGDYSILTANPPYSVKGFLETLSDSDRNDYQLLSTIDEKSFSNNNAIETFFIERAKQLLKPGGVAGIIVPSSILTKGKAKSTSKATNLYVATRELLIKYFDIVAIAEFGSGTFGKTGTNTVTLFIRRKEENPSLAEHYENRVNDWFSECGDKDLIFEDEYLIKDYCSEIEVPYEEYKSLLIGKPTEKLLDSDIFQDYKKEFSNWTEIKNRKKQKTFKELNKEQQHKELSERFVSYLTRVEKDKILYFSLAALNPQKVLIVKSPSNNTKIKEFLGYEWSSAKGNEGIKYLGSEDNIVIKTENDDDSEASLDDEDKRIINNIFNLNNIKTPLYDPASVFNPSKINTLISRNFSGEDITIPSELAEYVSQASLISMLDFVSVNFNKGISLSPRIDDEPVVETKWDTEPLGKVAPYVKDKINLSEIDVTSYVTTDNLLQNRMGVVDFDGTPNVDRITRYLKNDVLISNIRPYLKKIWFSSKEGGCSNDVMVFRSSNPTKVLPKYLYLSLSTDLFFDYVMAGKQGVKMPRGDKDKILKYPLAIPPKEVQEKIILECESIDSEVDKAKNTIEVESQKIESLFQESMNSKLKSYKLSDENLFKVSIGKRVLKKEINHEQKGVPVYSANVFEAFGHIEKKLIDNFDIESVLWGIDGDWMVNTLPKDVPFYPTDHCGVLRVLSTDIEPKFVAWALKNEGQRVRYSRHNRASMDSIKTLSIQLPDSSKQKGIVDKVLICESQIESAKNLIRGAQARKEEILNKYLK
ncbi:N-6 DNA methylase [Pseudoalteromonas sp. PAR1]|uniref:N-6 DNA methylase n=1 Tax=Pseudoalteromonas sp. PAR1 TaxID=2853443 RepID=UPI00248C5B4B|nr:N-6 DNA methylase [Pseudoalteromonas sp. PAR1]